MERVKQIMEHPLYQYHQQRIEEAEKDRIFCRHGREHALDVARILYIQILENGLSVKKDVVYGTALLHDIGRVAQMEHGIPHEQASAEFAQQILPDAGFNEEELSEVTAAILSHREDCSVSELGKILYQADKRSRDCWCCSASNLCNWPEQKKNKGIFR